MQIGFFILGAVVLSRTYSIGGYLGLTVITALLSLALLSLQERLSYLVSGIRTTSSKLLSEKWRGSLEVQQTDVRQLHLEAMKKLCEKRKGELATHEAELVDGTHA